ncbi:MAG: penicillin-binding protein, partial [Actinobacteria bacterium]
KNVYTGTEHTFARKIREALLAVKLAHQLSKDEILAAYLNTIYFGNGAYGVQAAAETYWGIPARKLSVVQSATLAATINAPALYDPVDNPTATKERRDLVLGLMAQQGYITDAIQFQAAPLTVDKPTQAPAPHGYFVSYVSQALQQQLGYEETFAGGLRVTTTLDLADQVAAEKAVAARLPKKNDPSAALVAIDPTTGAILAMVGGTDFNKVQLNLATQAHRQAGSAFKPFTLATAMGERISLQSIWNGPSSITIPNKECYTNGAPWKVSNYADESAGTMTLRDATAQSRRRRRPSGSRRPCRPSARSPWGHSS